MAECLCAGHQLLLIPEPLYYYRRRMNSVSSPDTYQKQLDGNRIHIQLCEDLMSKYKHNAGLRKAIQSRIALNKLKIIELMIEEKMKSGKPLIALQHIVSHLAVLRPLLRNFKNKMLL